MMKWAVHDVIEVASSKIDKVDFHISKCLLDNPYRKYNNNPSLPKCLQCWTRTNKPNVGRIQFDCRSCFLMNIQYRYLIKVDSLMVFGNRVTIINEGTWYTESMGVSLVMKNLIASHIGWAAPTNRAVENQRWFSCLQSSPVDSPPGH